MVLIPSHIARSVDDADTCVSIERAFLEGPCIVLSQLDYLVATLCGGIGCSAGSLIDEGYGAIRILYQLPQEAVVAIYFAAGYHSATCTCGISATEESAIQVIVILLAKSQVGYCRCFATHLCQLHAVDIAGPSRRIVEAHCVFSLIEGYVKFC